MFYAIWCTLCVLFFVLMLIRANIVGRFRVKMLDEESEWLREDVNRWKGRFLRYESLPSYTRIMLMIWKPIHQFEKELGSVEEFYANLTSLSSTR